MHKNPRKHVHKEMVYIIWILLVFVLRVYNNIPFYKKNKKFINLLKMNDWYMALRAGPMNLVRNFPSPLGKPVFCRYTGANSHLNALFTSSSNSVPRHSNIHFYTRVPNSATPIMQKSFLQNWRGIISLAVNMEHYNNSTR